MIETAIEVTDARVPARVIAKLIEAVVPLPVSIPGTALVTVPVVAVLVGLASAMVGIRKVRVFQESGFGQAVFEAILLRRYSCTKTVMPYLCFGECAGQGTVPII